MADVQADAVRPDMDILDDIHQWMRDYPPLVNDRRHIEVSVDQGAVTVRGNIKTPITRAYVQQNITDVPGVNAVHADGLYDDESIRLAVGPLLTQGMMANVEWGVVVLSGIIPADAALEQVVARIAQISGVQRVVSVG